MLRSFVCQQFWEDLQKGVVVRGPHTFGQQVYVHPMEIHHALLCYIKNGCVLLLWSVTQQRTGSQCNFNNPFGRVQPAGNYRSRGLGAEHFCRLTNCSTPDIFPHASRQATDEENAQSSFYEYIPNVYT